MLDAQTLEPIKVVDSDNPTDHLANGFVGKVKADTARRALRDNAIKPYELDETELK